jgi:hypothetical protein
MPEMAQYWQKMSLSWGQKGQKIASDVLKFFKQYTCLLFED